MEDLAASVQTNAYSAAWFSRFLHCIDPVQTERETAFLAQHLKPQSRVLDAACGAGRHARLLAARGHRVIGMDRDSSLLGSPVARLAWLCADLRALPLRSHSVDAVLSLWQSFGYFDADQNAELLRQWARLVRPGGRLILDLYHRGFFERHRGERWIERASGRVREARRMEAGRLVVDLFYEGSGHRDRFEWQLFHPEEMEGMATACGWSLVRACSGFDVHQLPDPSQPRVQYVFTRSAA